MARPRSRAGMLLPPCRLKLGQAHRARKRCSPVHATSGPRGSAGVAAAADGTPYLEDGQGLILANVLEVDLLLLLPADSHGRIACKGGVGRGTTREQAGTGALKTRCLQGSPP